jgi:hypothetical protein
MLSSQLRERITVYSQVTSTTNKGQRNLNYRLAFYDRADISFESAANQFAANAEVIGKVNRFKVRFALGRYLETMIIFWRGDYYTITSPEADARKTYLYIKGTRAMPGTIEIIV